MQIEQLRLESEAYAAIRYRLRNEETSAEIAYNIKDDKYEVLVASIDWISKDFDTLDSALNYAYGALL